MVLLAPAGAIIAGILGLGAVVALYLLRLRRRPVWVSSILLWTPSARDLEVNVPIRMPRSSWLLMLHLLIAALLALAIGRPALQDPGRGTPRTIIIVDHSASMGATDAGQAQRNGTSLTRLDAAKREVRSILRGAARSDRSAVALIAIAAEARILAGLSLDPGMVERALDPLTPTDQAIGSDPADRTSLDAALDLAEAMLAESPTEEADAARVVIVSDGDLPPVRERAVPGARVDFVRVGPASEPPGRENLGIVALAARQMEGGGGSVRLFARVTNASQRERSIFAIVGVGGVEVTRRALTIGARDDAPLSIDLTLPPEDTVVSVRLDVSDALPADNEASILVPVMRPIRVLVVTPSGEPDRDGSWPLTDALREIPGTLVRAISEEAWRSMSALPPETDLFADLIVLHAVAPAWEQSRPPRVPMLRFGSAPAKEGSTAPASAIIAWDRAHPLMRHVSLDGVVVDPEASAKAVLASDFTPIAWTEQGAVIGVADREGVRAISVGFTVSATNWPLVYAWPLFVDNAVAWLTRRDAIESGRVWTTSEPIITLWPLGAERAALRSPDGAILRADIEPIGGMLRLGAILRAGVYTLTQEPTQTGGMSAPLPIALLDPSESALATRDRISIGATPIASTPGSSGPREVWDLFVVAACVLLTIEWFFFAFRARVA